MQRRQIPHLLTCAAMAMMLPPGHAAPAPTAASAASSGESGGDASADAWFIFLVTGRKTPDDKAAVEAMQRGHIDNFKRLFALGRLQSAGPLRDPSGIKRGIVTVRAVTRDEVRSLFEPDAYVREGYMTVDAQPATIHKALNTEGIDDTRVTEVRIVQILRGAGEPTGPSSGADTPRARYLRGLVDRGTVGAWYTLQFGPVAEVLFANSTDTASLQAAFAGCPGLASGALAVWPQWLSPGVVR